MGWYHKKGYHRHQQALENGGLFDLAQCEYMANPNWQNGFCMAYQDLTNDRCFLTPVHMDYDGTFVFNGKYYG